MNYIGNRDRRTDADIFKAFIRNKRTINYWQLQDGLTKLQHQNSKFKIEWRIDITVDKYYVVATKVIGQSKLDHLVCIMTNDADECHNCIIIYDDLLNRRQIQLIHMFAREDAKNRNL